MKLWKFIEANRKRDAFELEYKNLNTELVTRFPELKNAVLEALEGYEPDEMVYIVYGNTLCPYVNRLLEADVEREKIKEIFCFYEELAQSTDEEVQNFLQVALLEPFWENRRLYDAACQYMGPKTAEINRNNLNYFHIPLELDADTEQ